MKRLLKKIKDFLLNVTDLVISWIPIVISMIVIILLSILIGYFIGKSVWIVFVADLVFFYLLWLFFTFHVRRGKKLKKNTLIWSMIILFLFIALSTLGVSVVTEQRFISNIFIFPIGCFVALSLSSKVKNRK